jgi:hypothetical protein
MTPISPDSPTDNAAADAVTLERLKAFYRSMDSSSLRQLPEIYHAHTVLIDPVGRHEGLDALRQYFEQLLAQTLYCRFDILQTLTQDRETVLFWRMIYAHPRLNKGKELTLDGTSHLRFSENRVIYQRDFYDLGAMLYEHIPLLGSAVKAVKSRLAS